MKKVLAIMILSLLFFWAQLSGSGLVGSNSPGASGLRLNPQDPASPPAPPALTAPAETKHAVAQRAASGRSSANEAGREPQGWTRAAGTYGLLAGGMLAVALRRRRLLQAYPA